MLNIDEMNFSFLIYFNILSWTCSNRVTVHHQQAVTVYAAYGIYRASTLTSF